MSPRGSRQRTPSATVSGGTREAGRKLGSQLFELEQPMSRAFVNEDAGGRPSGRRFVLPPRTDPGFEPRLRAHVERILAAARTDRDERLVQLAERWLR